MNDFPPMSARIPYEDGTTMTQVLLDKTYSLVLNTDGAGTTDHILGLPAGQGGVYVVSGQLFMAWNCSYLNGLWKPFSAGSASWLMGYGADSIVISRAPPGSSTFVPIMTIPNSGGLILPDGTRLSSAKLSGLSDTNIAAPLNGQSLIWNSTLSMWQNGSPVGGSLATLTDVALSSQTNGQVLAWNSATSRWVNANATSNTLAGLTDCNVAGPLTGQVLAWSGSHWQNTASGASIPIKFISPSGADDAAQINAALAANQLVVLTAGDFQISSASVNAFQATASLVGLGLAVTRLHVVIASLDGIVVPATCTQFNIGGFTIDRTLAPTGSAMGINASALTKASGGTFFDIVSTGHITGIALGAALYSTCRFVRANANTSDGFRIAPPTQADTLLQWNMLNCAAYTNGGWGFRVAAGTFTAATLLPLMPWADCKTQANTLGGIGFLGSVNGQLENIILLGGEFNGDNADILYLDTYGSNNYLLDVFVENAGQMNTGTNPSTPATGLGSGIHVTANNGLTRIDGGGSEMNSVHGILIDSAIAAITNHAAYNNSYQTVNTNDGIHFSAAGASAILTSNQCKNYGTALQGNKSSQRYGVWVADGTNCSLTGNGLVGNTSGAFFVNTNPTLLKSFGNQGYPSQAGDAFTVTGTLTANGSFVANGTANVVGALTVAGNATANLQVVPLQQLNSALGGYLPLTGGTLAGPGNLTVNGGETVLGNVNANNGYLISGTNSNTGYLFLNGPAGQFRKVVVQTAGSSRIEFGASGDAESGSNAGSNFYVARYNDSGGWVDEPFTINRANGGVTVGQTLSVNSTLWANGFLSCGNNIQLPANNSLYWTGSANPYISGDGSGLLKLAATSQIQIIGPMFWPLNDNTTNLGWSGNRWIWVFAVNGAINTSDGRDKKNVRQADLGLEFVNKLKPVSYEWIEEKEKTGTHYGLVAQDIEEALDGKEFAGLWKPKEEGDHYGLAYHEVVAVLVKAVQELTAQVGELERRLAT